jgi:hypothetical protein
MEQDELICLACGYKNKGYRHDCKNCGKVLVVEVAEKRKKPLVIKSLVDIVYSGVGLFSLVMAFLIGISLAEKARSQWAFLIGLIFGVALFSAGAIFLFFLPLFYLCIFLLGNRAAGGKVATYFSKEIESDNGLVITNYVIVRYWPELAHDSRPRLLTCKIVGKEPTPDGEDKLIVRYAVLNPAIVLLEGE